MKVLFQPVKHAKIEELYEVDTLMEGIRRIKNLKETIPGHFYYKGKNVLHFHIDRSSIYADVGNTRIMIENKQECFKTIIDNIQAYIEEINRVQSKNKTNG